MWSQTTAGENVSIWSICTGDAPDGYLSPYAASIHHRWNIKKDAIDKLCYEIFHANICENNCALKETMNTGRNIINKTIYIVNSEGEKIPISISTALLKNKENEVIGGVETFRDMSAIEALRKEIQEKYTFEDIVSKNKNIHELFSILPDIAKLGAAMVKITAIFA